MKSTDVSPCVKTDFSIQQMLEKNCLRYAYEQLEMVKKMAGFPEDMEDIKVEVQLQLLLPYKENTDE